MTKNFSNDLMRRADAAEYLGVRPHTLAVWAVTGRYQLPFIKFGRMVYYRKTDLDKFHERHTRSA